MIAERDVLFVVDGDYIFRSAQATYGKEYRISYPKLQDLMKRGRERDLCYHMAVFVTVKSERNTQLGFVSRLSQLGFDIHAFASEYDVLTGEVHRKDYLAEMVQFIKDFRCRGNYPRTLVVASASAALADLYIGLAYLGVVIEVMYVDALSAKITDIHKSILLGEDVLYKH
jgi:hypothetical protein